MTFLEAINQVMVRLREDEVEAWDGSDYSKLIGRLVNEAKAEVEDAHEWNCLKDQFDASVVADDTTVSFTGTSQRTRIVQVFNQTETTRMQRVDRDRIIYWRNIGSSTSGVPYWFSQHGYTTSSELELIIYPDADGSYTIRLDSLHNHSDACR